MGKNSRAKTTARKTSVEAVYLICSLPMIDAQPEQVAAWIQEHWGIENRLYWVRDVVFDEDRHRLRTANGPAIMAMPAYRAPASSAFHGTRTAIASTIKVSVKTPQRAIKLITHPTT